MSLYEQPDASSGSSLVSVCEYGGDVVAEVTVRRGFAPVFAEMLELLFGETHYVVLEELGGWIQGFGDEAYGPASA